MSPTLLNNLLKEVSQNVPFYSSYKEANINDYPFMTKKVIKDDYEMFLSKNIEDRQSVLKSLVSPMEIHNYVIEKDLGADLIMEWTTGSSGIPFKCIKKNKERNIISLNIWKRRMRIDRTLVPKNFFPLIHTGVSCIPFDVRDYSHENLNDLYSYIKNHNFSCVHTTPTLLKRHVLDSNIDQSIFIDSVKYIESTGSFLSQSEKKIFEKAFNATILNSYGLIELWTIAYSCKLGNMHVINDNIYLELVDEKGSIIQEPNKFGQVTVTGLHQHTMPFIRYLTGDYAKYTGEQCVCGDHAPVIRLQESRIINYLAYNGLKIDGNKFMKKMLKYVFWKHEFNEINYLCLVQDGNLFLFYLNLFTDYKMFQNLMSDALINELGPDIIIDYKYVSLQEYEEINFKNHLFINRSNKSNKMDSIIGEIR